MRRSAKRHQTVSELDSSGTSQYLLGLFKPQSIEEGKRRVKIMTGLASLLSQEQALAEAANSAVVQPWAEAHFALMQRAVARGEISASADIGTLSQVVGMDTAIRDARRSLRHHLGPGRRDGVQSVLSQRSHQLGA
jgi:tetracycline repressor-like protein